MLPPPLPAVVKKRISAAQAQQVINSAADGDARLLLQVLDGVKRRVEAQGGLMSPGAPAPAVSAADLARARQHIQALQRQQQLN